VNTAPKEGKALGKMGGGQPHKSGCFCADKRKKEYGAPPHQDKQFLSVTVPQQGVTGLQSVLPRRSSAQQKEEAKMPCLQVVLCQFCSPSPQTPPCPSRLGSDSPCRSSPRSGRETKLRAGHAARVPLRSAVRHPALLCQTPSLLLSRSGASQRGGGQH